MERNDRLKFVANTISPTVWSHDGDKNMMLVVRRLLLLNNSESEALAAKVAELERFCGQLAMENAVLKKALTKQKSPSDMR